VPLNRYTEHEQATFEAESAPKGREATESLLESPSNLQQDTQDAPDSTRSDDLQAEPHDTPDAHLDGEGEGEERSNRTDRCQAGLKEAINSAPKSASFVGTERHDAQLLIHDEGKKGNEGDENERIDEDEEGGKGGEEQTEQVEEEEGASSAHRVEGSDDGEQEALETLYMEPGPTLIEERLE
jgi:hypothetical protein